MHPSYPLRLFALILGNDQKLTINDASDLGGDLNEKLAMKYALPEKFNFNRTQLRRNDGKPVRL